MPASHHPAPDSPGGDIWDRARQLRLLAATWRMSTPAELGDLVAPLSQLTGPTWDCMRHIAPVWIGYVERDEDDLLWRLLHTPADRACTRCAHLGWPVEQIRLAADGEVWCTYHLGALLADISIGTENGVLDVQRAGMRA